MDLVKIQGFLHITIWVSLLRPIKCSAVMITSFYNVIRNRAIFLNIPSPYN